MQNPIHWIRDYYYQVVAELKKCTWPGRQELMESTIVVIISVIFLSLFVTSIDWICKEMIQLLTASW